MHNYNLISALDSGAEQILLIMLITFIQFKPFTIFIWPGIAGFFENTD